MKKKIKKTNVLSLKIRSKIIAPPSKIFLDKKKEQSKKQCRKNVNQ